MRSTFSACTLDHSRETSSVRTHLLHPAPPASSPFPLTQPRWQPGPTLLKCHVSGGTPRVRHCYMAHSRHSSQGSCTLGTRTAAPRCPSRGSPHTAASRRPSALKWRALRLFSSQISISQTLKLASCFKYRKMCLVQLTRLIFACMPAATYVSTVCCVCGSLTPIWVVG